MSQDKFWLQFNNGKKEQLNDAKHGVRKEQVDKKYHNLFDGYDTNNDGTLEENELETIKEHFKRFAGDNTLTHEENLKAKSVFADKVQMEDADFMGFIKSVSDAAEEIVSSKEKITRDGGKEVTTYYKNGTIETIAYYKNGDFKWKKVTEKFEKTTYEMTINGQRKELTEEEYKKALEESKKREAQQKPVEHNDGLSGTRFPSNGEVITISSNTTTEEKYREEYSPKFIVETLGIDVQSEEGLKILERLSYLPKDALQLVKDGSEIKELLAQNDLPPSFDNISNILELMYGITIRDEEEMEASHKQREQLIAQIQTVEMMSELYTVVAQYNDEYTDSQGLFGLGAEGIGWLMNVVGIDGENHYQWANSCREFAEKISGFKVLNPEKFNEEFKELTGKNKFDINALQKMVNLVKEGKAQDEEGNYTEEYKEAVKAFSNFDISNPNAKAWYHPDNLMSGFGEALIMIMTLGWGAETQGGKILAMSTIGGFSRLGVAVASNQVRNRLLQGALRLSGQGIKLIGPALNEGTKMYLYSALTGTATNIANRGIKFDSEENSLDKLLAVEGMVLDGAVGSFAFGAFAGVFGSTVTQKVMQSVSKVSSKVGTALADRFAKGAVEASDAYITILEKSMPTKVAEAAAFAADIFGFTAFESAMALYHAVNDKQKYPNGISIDDFTKILWEEFRGQGVNLGQIKGVSYLIMFLTGSRSARMQASKYMRDNLPQLKGSTIDKLEKGYRINLPDGRKIECKNENEMISSLHLMVRGETAFSKKFDKKQIIDEVRQNNDIGAAIAIIQTASSRDDLAPVREFLKNMEAGEEKTALQEMYFRKAAEIQKNETEFEKSIKADLRASDFEDMDIEDIHYEAEKILNELPHSIWKDMRTPSWYRAVELISESTNKDNIVLLKDMFVKFFSSKDGLEQTDTPIQLKQILENITNPTTAKLAELMLKRDISLKNFKEFIELSVEEPQVAYNFYKSGAAFNKNYTVSEIYAYDHSSPESIRFISNLAEKNGLPKNRETQYLLSKIRYELAEIYLKEGMTEEEIFSVLIKLREFQGADTTLLIEVNRTHPEWIEGIDLETLRSAHGMESLKAGFDAISELDASIFEKIPGAKDYVYLQAIHTHKHWTSPTTYKTRIENIKKIAKYDEKTGEALLKLIKELETSPETDDPEESLYLYMTSLDKAIELHNLDYIADYLRNNDYKITNFIKQVAISDVDVTKTEPLYNEIQTRKEELIREVSLKCKDTSPEFADWVKKFLNSDDAKTLMQIENLNVNDLIENFYQTSKIIKAFNKNPENFINGNYPTFILNALIEYRQLGNDSPKFKSLSTNEKRTVRRLDDIVKDNFDKQYKKIFRAVCATDAETVIQLFDKHMDIFNEKLKEIADIPDTYKTILSDLIRNGKRLNKNGQPVNLSGKQKTELIKTIAIYVDIEKRTNEHVDFEKFKTSLSDGSFILDIDGLRQNLFNIFLKNQGMTEAEIAGLKPENLNWDPKNISLLAIKVLGDEGELGDVVREASRGNFQNYIKDTSNPHGAANAETERMFKAEKLDYNAWQKGPIEHRIIINGETYTVKLWNRIPQESLFDGTYTSCCTALDAGNGGSMANYMLNTAINVVEVRNSAGEVVAMSRCYIGKNSQNVPVFIIENIEVNNTFNDMLNHTSSSGELSEGIFDYIIDYATEVGGKDMPIYMSTSFHKLSGSVFKDFKHETMKISFVGKISKEEIYLNTYGQYVNPSEPNEPAGFHIIREGKPEKPTRKNTRPSIPHETPVIETQDESNLTTRRISPETVQKLIEKANGNQRVINNIYKLIDAGASSGLLMDIVHRLDVPENIVETYLQKFKETEDGVTYHLFALINNLQDSSGLKSNYQELFEYSLELFEKTSNGKKLTANQVADLLNFGRGDKSTIDLMIDYMNIAELGSNQLKPKDIADLMPHIKENPQAKERITKIAKLTPEQIEAHENQPFDGKLIKQILEIENLTDKQLEIIKSMLCDKSLENIILSDYLKVEVVQHLGFDENLTDLFKILITTDLHPVNSWGRKTPNYIDVCDIVREFPNKEDIITVKTLLEHKAENKFGKRLTTLDFVRITKDELAKMREFIEVVKNNENLMDNLSFRIVNDEKRLNTILQMLKENPNLTYDKIVMEVDILPKIKHIKNKELYDLALEVEKRGLKTASDLIQEISYKIDDVEDEYLSNTIKTLLIEAKEYLDKDSSEGIKISLPLIDKWLDAYHSLKGDYEYIGTKYSPTYKRELYQFVKENEPQRAEELNRAIQEGKFDSDNSEWSSIMRDFAKESGIERLRTLLKENPNDSMGEYLYKKYYLPTLPEAVSKKCEEISKKYRTNIFLNSIENPELLDRILDFIDTEFKEWKDKSHNTCVYPSILDFSKAKRSYVDTESAYGESTSCGFAENGTNNSISLDGYENAIYALRHEMTHINDTKKGMGAGVEYNVNEIMPKITDENGKEKIDFEHCKYREEFLKAGISAHLIKYAYHNTEEFIAVASEGDMSKYSEEFKKVLVSFGMPEWMLNMEQTNKETVFRAEKVNYLIEFAKQKELLIDGKLTDVSKDYDVLSELLYGFELCERISSIAAKEFRKYNVPDDPMKLFEYCIDKDNQDEILQDLGKIKDILLSNVTGENEPATPKAIGEGLIPTERAKLEHAVITNPSEVAEVKVRQEWQQEDLTKPAEETEVDLFNIDQEAGLKETPRFQDNEVTDLILKGLLGEKLTERYEKLNLGVQAILLEHRAEMRELAEKYADDNRLFAQKVVEILAKEFNLEDVELTVRFVPEEEIQAAASYDWILGYINLSDKITDKNLIVGNVVHEFIHSIQFANVVAQYGKSKVREILNKTFENRTDITPEKIEFLLESDYIQQLSERVQQNWSTKPNGTLNEYVRRIYMDEFENHNKQEYWNKLTEREAYFIGTKNGASLGITEPLSREQYEKLKQDNPNIKEDSEGRVYKVEQDGTETTLGIKLPASFVLTGKETLETLLKVKEEVEKALQSMENINSPELQEAYAKYKESLDRAIKLAEQIKYEEAQSNIEKEFKTINRAAAEEAINKANTAETNSRDYYIRMLIEACTINGSVSEELVKRMVDFIQKDSSDLYKIQEIIQCFKCQYGIDRGAIKKFEELTNNSNGDTDTTRKIIENCKDEDGRFRSDYYEKLQQIASNDSSWAHYVLNSCKTTRKIGNAEVRDVDEELWAKALELKDMGFSNFNIHCLMDICRQTVKDNKYELGEFSQERFELIKELKDKYNINLDDISNILGECVDNGEFNYSKYEAAKMLVSHIKDSDISSSLNDFARIEDKELALKHYDELQQKYGFESRRIAYVYRKCCDEIKISDQEKSFKFNQTKYEKALELKTKYNTDDFDIQQYLKTCTIDGKFEEAIYNKIIEYKKYNFSDNVLNEIIRECIHPLKGQSSWEHSDIDYKLLDKIGVWCEVYISNRKSDEPMTQYDYDDMGRYFANILDRIESKDCEATDYIEKFLKFDCLSRISSRLNEATMRDENGYYYHPPKYDTKVLDAMLVWAEKYGFKESEQFEVVMNLINNQKNLSKEDAIKYINELYDAGWNPENTRSFQAIIKHWGHNGNREFDIDAINLFKEYLQKGFSAGVITTAVYNCAKKGEPHTDEYYAVDKEKLDRTLEMVRYCHGDYKNEAASWLHHLSDHYKLISGILNEHHFKIPFDDFYYFVWNELCNVEIMSDPKKKALIPVVLEAIYKNPEQYSEIKEIIKHSLFFRSENFRDFSLRHAKNGDWKECIKRGQISPYFRHYGMQEFFEILNMLDTDKIPLVEEWGTNNVASYADAVCSNIWRYKGDGTNRQQYCPEVIAKIKELIEKGELKEIIIATGNTSLVFDNPDFCDVLDALAKVERENLLPKELLPYLFTKIRGGGHDITDNYFAPNYQEIIDFYIRHQDVLAKKIDSGVFSGLIGVEHVADFINDSGISDIETLEKIIEYSKHIDNINGIKTIANYTNCSIKQILNFLEKVDFEKYEKEVNSLFNQILEYANWNNESNVKARRNLFDEKLTKERVEIILDTEKLLGEKFDYDQRRSHQLTNEFYNLLLNDKIPEEALNKFRFYLEYTISLPQDDYRNKLDLSRMLQFINIYALRPDKIDFFEKYLFSGDENDIGFIHGIVTCLSTDKEVLDKQLEFLDEILTYDNAITSRYRIQEVLSSSDKIYTNAQMEVWNIIKPQKGKEKKGELSDALYTICSVRTYNKDVVIEAYTQKRFNSGELSNLANNTRAANKNLILKLLQDKKYSPSFIINLATHTYNDYQVEVAEMMFKDGTFTEEEIPNILNGLNQSNTPLGKKLLFDKEIDFPRDKVFDVLWSYTDFNEQLAWKICATKNRPIPDNKITLALKCYQNKEINLDMYINKFKMFLELDFSENFIKNILGTSGSISRYTRNFCAVLQHLQAKGLRAEKCVEILTTDALSENITTNIESLEILNSIEGDDIKLLQADGIDIYGKIQKLQKAVDVKHPIIDVPKGDEVAALKIIANNEQADKVIQTMDLTQFEGKDGQARGIPLEYTREEFTANMNRLIAAYTSGENSKIEDITHREVREIPHLELSEEAKSKVAQKIEEFREIYKHSTRQEEIIIDGKKCKAEHFVGSKSRGSNPGDYYVIDGNLYYVKTPNSDKLGQSVEEVIASRLYRAAGIDAPNEHYIYNEKGEVIGMASEYIPDMEARNWGHVDEAEAKLMFDSFAVDAWLADWDAPKNDNTQIYDGNKIIKSDVGGSMHYRARGEIKEDFNGIVIELLTLIENNNILYSKMTKQDVLNSIKRVLDIPDETIYQTIMEAPSHDLGLAKTMIRRKAYMQKFYENLEKLADNGQNVVDLIIEAQGMTVAEFKEVPDIAAAFGYIRTENGFEGLLNTRGSEKLQLAPEEQEIADKIKAEIERFTIHNQMAVSADVPEEVRNFVNGILKGIPEFAQYFSKPQHGNGNVDSNGKQINGHQYSLDIHILNVLQKSLNNPLYEKVDEYGFPLLDDESKIVLKFSALMHDIGKMYMSGKDEGHAERSAEYVYSILDRFNLPTRVKNRIINIINNHHWFEMLCTGVINEQQVAATFRTTADFTIARIMAQADLESVYEGYFTSRMSRNFPSEVTNEQSAYQKFNKMMDNIQQKVNQIEETSAVVTPSKFVEVPEHIGSDGKVVPRRGFPIVEIELDGKVEQFRILNLNDLDPETDMYQFGFNHIKLKDLKLLVHRFGDREWGKFATTKLLGDNPIRTSVQSLSLISPKHAAAYSGRNFSCIMEGNNANIGVAYYKNAGTGQWKNLSNLIEELFDPHYEKKRNFFKNEFLKFMEERGIKISDKEYGTIMRYARNKQYIETQLRDLNLGNKIIKREDLVDALLFAEQRLIEKQKDEYSEHHNEETLIDCHVIAGGASLKTVDELKEKTEFLRTCRDNCDGTIILW